MPMPFDFVPLPALPRGELPLVGRARVHGDNVAIRSSDGNWTYAELLRASADIATRLGGGGDVAEARIAFMAPIGFPYLAIQWGIWRSGGVAIPLSSAAALPELAYCLVDSGAQILVCAEEPSPSVVALCESVGCRLEIWPRGDSPADGEVALPEIAAHRRAMILYTSGTTSRPKGVVTTHANIQAQIESLVAAWAWNPADRIPLFLPMHHIHGIINIAGCALWSGATIEAFPKFEAAAVLERVADGAYTVFMAVPTIYVKLIELLDSPGFSPDLGNRAREGFSRLRLMVSGSAALPPSVHEKWETLTKQSLVERYGMTETGMTISNPLRGERRRGAVGIPLPGVEVRLRSDRGETIHADQEPGEIQVRGAGIFVEYWNRPDVTADSFDEGWFRTGDMAVRENGYYRIMGRLSVDIIKSGGFKLSALEIEAALLEHPSIRECAVVGVPDETWGEIVAVALSPEDGAFLDLEAVRHWGKKRLSSYKLPQRLILVDHLPRNAMGKVQKRMVADLFAAPEIP